MIDVHMHMVLDGVDWRAAIGRHQPEPREAWIREILSRYRDLGYTYLRDGGDRWGVSALARKLAPEYGITYRTPLAPISRKGHYGGFIGIQYEDLRDYAQIVARQRELGADFIKIMISGLMDFDQYGVLTEPGLPPEEIRELCHIAHEEGFFVMAHCNGARTMEAAARFGVDSIEHGAYADRAALEVMADMGTVWVPTLSTVGNLRGTGCFQEEAVERILDSALQNAALFGQLGGLLAPGTDAGAWAVPHGSGTELPLLESAGITLPQLAKGEAVIRAKF